MPSRQRSTFQKPERDSLDGVKARRDQHSAVSDRERAGGSTCPRSFTRDRNAATTPRQHQSGCHRLNEESTTHGKLIILSARAPLQFTARPVVVILTLLQIMLISCAGSSFWLANSRPIHVSFVNSHCFRSDLEVPCRIFNYRAKCRSLKIMENVPDRSPN